MQRRCYAALAALALLLPGLVRGAAAQSSAQAVQSDIEKTVFGSGTIQPASQPGVYALTDAKAGKPLVGLGDAVSKGDLLMTLKSDELEHEIEQIEYDLQILMNDIAHTEEHSQYQYVQVVDENGKPRRDVDTGEMLFEQYSNEITIYAPTGGRVMAVYIEPGDDALAVFREKGSVLILSTDGRMRIDLSEISGGLLSLEETVRVAGEGFETSGTVVDVSQNGVRATIQVNDDSFPMGAPVIVTKENGTYVGEGILEINKPIGVSAYGGTIKGLAWNAKVGYHMEAEDVIARIAWDDLPLYIDNDEKLRAYAVKLAELEEAKKRLESLAVVAPCDGWIADIEVDEGESVTDGTRIMRIVEDVGMTLTLSVDELDIVSVAPGQTVRFTVDALGDEEYSGRVRTIAPLGNTESAVTTYDVYVDITDELDEDVLGGMNVTGEIVVLTAENTLTIPTDALRKDDMSWYVQLGNGEYAEVQPGIMTDDRTQILSGLDKGVTVVY